MTESGEGQSRLPSNTIEQRVRGGGRTGPGGDLGHLLACAIAAAVGLLLGVVDAPPAAAVAERGVAVALELPTGWGAAPLVQESPPLERRLRISVRETIKGVRRFLKRAVYLVTNSPTWWWRRVKRAAWPVVFAVAALFFDTGLLSAWKNEGVRVLATYVPMMLYIYSRLFFSRGVSIITRLGVLVALVYGMWRHDLLADGRWSSIGLGKFDDLIVIALAVRAFVASCPEELVSLYADRAIAIRSRITRAASTPS